MTGAGDRAPPLRVVGVSNAAVSAAGGRYGEAVDVYSGQQPHSPFARAQQECQFCLFHQGWTRFFRGVWWLAGRSRSDVALPH